ncbi:DUF429 domain-containing protein [Ruegeria marina]|uniref:DUF429 domain-containing protein n=1 Tax=Ruegeria marina TaxID=639004 RepID=A0A1G7D9D9_9RHOB|nr:DUF429 domain-containing protein [Ruegeria marina]SDE48162.1 Protein of unknown function [Ruegeria marina]
MKIIGIDFTSRPSRRKPITALHCSFESGTLTAENLERWANFSLLETFLKTPGPWIAGIDFPFGQARRFIETIGWPQDWAGYVNHVGKADRKDFRRELDEYRKDRPAGDKEHRRATDIAASSISPQKLYGVPVGLMFFEGAPRLIEAGVTIPHLMQGDPQRIVVEAYPGVAARNLIGKRSYKNDTKKKQTDDQRHARLDVLEELKRRSQKLYGFTIEADTSLCDDPGADSLDALLCAAQAAWAWTQRDEGFGAPATVDPLEGWIADPILRGTV